MKNALDDLAAGAGVGVFVASLTPRPIGRVDVLAELLLAARAAVDRAIALLEQVELP